MCQLSIGSIDKYCEVCNRLVNICERDEIKPDPKYIRQAQLAMMIYSFASQAVKKTMNSRNKFVKDHVAKIELYAESLVNLTKEIMKFQKAVKDSIVIKHYRQVHESLHVDIGPFEASELCLSTVIFIYNTGIKIIWDDIIDICNGVRTYYDKIDFPSKDELSRIENCARVALEFLNKN
jgi:hypothetical protein